MRFITPLEEPLLYGARKTREISLCRAIMQSDRARETSSKLSKNTESMCGLMLRYDDAPDQNQYDHSNVRRSEYQASIMVGDNKADHVKAHPRASRENCKAVSVM